MFKRNEGKLDRIARVILGLVLLSVGLFWLGGLQGTVLGLSITGFSLLPLITGLTGFCPLYIPFGISTLEMEREFIARCKAMMDSYNQESGSSKQTGAESFCGSCPPIIRTTHPQQE